MTRKRQKDSIEHDDPHWIEWLTGIASTLLVLAMLGWIAVEALREGGGPPELSLQVTASDRTAGGAHRFHFDIANSAGSTAAGVTVRGELKDVGGVVERSEVTFDYVPAESRTRGAILFQSDPAGREMTIAVSGYTEP